MITSIKMYSLLEYSQCFALMHSGVCRQIPNQMKVIHLAIMFELGQTKLICNH